MAEAPSYTTVPGRISDLLKKIRDTGVPPKATNDWLKSVGFTNSNDRTLVRVLRQIGFVDGSGVPQPAWREYRGSDHRNVLGRALVLGYDTLYAMYPDAHSRPTTDLAHFFSSKTDAGKQSISLMVTTFKNLAKEADFDAMPSNPGSSTSGAPDPRTNGDAGGGDSGGGGGEGPNFDSEAKC
jgi:hypothetical protein